MRTFVVFALMGALLGCAAQVDAQPKRRFNAIVWDNYDPSNPRFEFIQENASCARAAGPTHFTVAQGWNPNYRYSEKLFQNDCMYEPKELHWLVKASRPRDGFEWQCRMRLIRRFDQESGWFVTRVETEAVQPVEPGSADPCTDGTLFKSAVCEVSDVQSFGRENCLNRDSDYNGRTTVVFGGPPLPAVPASERLNPLTAGASR